MISYLKINVIPNQAEVSAFLLIGEEQSLKSSVRGITVKLGLWEDHRRSVQGWTGAGPLLLWGTISCLFQAASIVCVVLLG